MLRVSGRRFDVDKYLQRSSLVLVAAHRRVEAVFAASQPKGRKNLRSGANFYVSRRDRSDFYAQVQDASRFLRRFRTEVRRLRRFSGVESASLDFGVEPADGTVAQSWRFPQELVSLASAVGDRSRGDRVLVF